MRSPLRVAVVSTPRTGNTWINYCISDLAQIHSFGLHRHTDLGDIALPERAVLQIHARYNDMKFRKFITDNDFSLVTVVRHPLDVLISMLRFIQVQTSPLQWLDGTTGIAKLYGVNPAQEQFVNWCLSDGARDLLSISYDWARSDQAYVIRYEDMLVNPIAELRAVLEKLQVNVTDDQIIAALKKFNPQFFKDQANHHSWQASKDNWQQFFTKEDAEKIYHRYRAIFDYFNYSIAGATHEKRDENLEEWDMPTALHAPEEVFQKAVKELEIHSKQLMVNTIHAQLERGEEIAKFSEEVSKRIEELVARQTEIDTLKKELEEILPLRKHMKRSLSRRLAQFNKQQLQEGGAD